MSDTFRTITAPSEAIFREKMSRFLAFAHPATTVDEAKAIIKDYSKKYFDARHVCWAYMIGPERQQFLSSDNGEPSGTAGKPILGQINSFGLTDVVIVVVRYFGGIKLGTSGLIVAYREAAKMAIEEAQIEERHAQQELAFSFPYLSMNAVMSLIKKPMPVPGEEGKPAESDLKILEQNFDNACTMRVRLRADAAPVLRERLGDVAGLCILD